MAILYILWCIYWK